MIHAGGLVDSKTVGSTVADYMNFRRKRDMSDSFHATDVDLVIYEKVFYNGFPYEQIYCALDYKRKGSLPDDLTYGEVIFYNDFTQSMPGPLSGQVLDKHVFIVSLELDTKDLDTTKIDLWEAKNFSVFRYLSGNPRPSRPAIVVNGKEVRETGNGVRVDLEYVMSNGSYQSYMEWENKYREERRKEAIMLLQKRYYMMGRK